MLASITNLLWHSASSSLYLDCSSTKKKKYCCRPGKGPDCFFTGCASSVTCPRYYSKLDQSRKGCSLLNSSAYCCRTKKLPNCFDLSCPTPTEGKKYCPSKYNEVSRTRGSCDTNSAEQVTCCKPSLNVGNSGAPAVTPKPVNPAAGKTRNRFMSNWFSFVLPEPVLDLNWDIKFQTQRELISIRFAHFRFRSTNLHQTF